MLNSETTVKDIQRQANVLGDAGKSFYSSLTGVSPNLHNLPGEKLKSDDGPQLCWFMNICIEMFMMYIYMNMYVHVNLFLSFQAECPEKKTFLQFEIN